MAADETLGAGAGAGAPRQRGLERALTLAGDAEYTAFFRAEYARTARTVYLVLHDQGRAEEITQDAFLQLLRSWGSVSGYEQPGAWVRRVAIRMAVRSAKRERMRSLLEWRSRALEGLVEDLPVPGSEVAAAIRSLPPNQRVAIVLHYFEDRPVADIADALGCAPATARVHLHKARQRLALLLHKRRSTMSLDDRLRIDLAELAETMDPTVEAALEAVLERARVRGSVGSRPSRSSRSLRPCCWSWAHWPGGSRDAMTRPGVGGRSVTALRDLPGDAHRRPGGGLADPLRRGLDVVVAPDNRALGTRVALCAVRRRRGGALHVPALKTVRL